MEIKAFFSRGIRRGARERQAIVSKHHISKDKFRKYTIFSFSAIQVNIPCPLGECLKIIFGGV